MNKEEINSKKILIMLPDKRDLDLELSSKALALFLNQFTQVRLYDLKERNLVDLPKEFDLKEIRSSGGDSFVFDLSGLEEEIRDVKWIQEKDRLKISILTPNRKLKVNEIKISDEKEVVDMVIYIGELSTKWEDYFALSEGGIKILITNRQNGINGITVKQFDYKTIAQSIMRVMEEIDKIDSKSATLLAAGIKWKTSNFRYSTDADLFVDYSKLVKIGIDEVEVSQISNGLLRFEELNLMKSMLENVQIHKGAVAISKVSDKERAGVDISKILYPSWNFLHDLKKIDIALVLIENSHSTAVFINSKLDKVNAGEIAKEFGGLGDKNRGAFTTTKSADEMELELKLKFDSLLEDIEEVTKEMEEDFNELKPEEKESIASESGLNLEETKEKSAEIKPGIEEPEKKLDEEIKQEDKLAEKEEITSEKTFDKERVSEIKSNPAPQETPPTSTTDNDPLAPATEIPEPINIEEELKKIRNSGNSSTDKPTIQAE